MPIPRSHERGRGRLFHALRNALGGVHGEDPEGYQPAHVERVVAAVGKLFGPGRYFGLEVRGFEHVPPAPALFVSNRSGGTTIPDVWGFAIAWYRHFGTARPLHVMAHELLFSTAVSGRFFERCGVLRATPGLAQDILMDHRRDLLVLPGGDADTWRPWTERYRVHFGGRTGYAKLALDAQVPIVPVAHAGAHETLMVLSSGQWLAHWLGLQRLARAQVWPVHLSLPWGLAIGPLPHLPLPAKFRYLIGEPIGPTAPLPCDEGDVIALDRQVREAVQTQLDALRLEAKNPR